MFQAIRDGRWQDAQMGLDAMKPGPLTPSPAPNSIPPRIAQGRTGAAGRAAQRSAELPEAADLARLAKVRGASELPPLPVAQRLIWQDGAPRRVRAKTIRSDEIAAELAVKMQPYIKGDQGAEAQVLLESTPGLTPEAQTEWQAKIAWMYFLTGDDLNTRAMAAKAANGVGDWAVQVAGRGACPRGGRTTAPRPAPASKASPRVRPTSICAPPRSIGRRARTWCADGDKVQPRLQNAAQYSESFYGQLARQALLIRDKGRRRRRWSPPTGRGSTSGPTSASPPR